MGRTVPARNAVARFGPPHRVPPPTRHRNYTPTHPFRIRRPGTAVVSPRVRSPPKADSADALPTSPTRSKPRFPFASGLDSEHAQNDVRPRSRRTDDGSRGAYPHQIRRNSSRVRRLRPSSAMFLRHHLANQHSRPPRFVIAMTNDTALPNGGRGCQSSEGLLPQVRHPRVRHPTHRSTNA